MAVQSEVLVFRDARALAHWLGGAVPRTPGLLGRPCTAYVLAPDPPAPGVPPSLGIVFEGLPASALPRSETNERARLVSAEIDLEQKKLRVLAAKAGILRRAQVAETFSIQETHKRPNVVQAVPLEPWAREPEDPEVIFLAPPGDAFSGLVTEHLELGRDGLRFAATQDQELGPRLLIDVARPSWFLLERWATSSNGHGEASPAMGAEANPAAVYAFRRL